MIVGVGTLLTCVHHDKYVALYSYTLNVQRPGITFFAIFFFLQSYCNNFYSVSELSLELTDFSFKTTF